MRNQSWIPSSSCGNRAEPVQFYLFLDVQHVVNTRETLYCGGNPIQLCAMTGDVWYTYTAVLVILWYRYQRGRGNYLPALRQLHFNDSLVPQWLGSWWWWEGASCKLAHVWNIDDCELVPESDPREPRPPIAHIHKDIAKTSITIVDLSEASTFEAGYRRPIVLSGASHETRRV